MNDNITWLAFSLKPNICLYTIHTQMLLCEQVLKTDKDKEEAKHEEEMAELMEKHSKEMTDLGKFTTMDRLTFISALLFFIQLALHNFCISINCLKALMVGNILV